MNYRFGMKKLTGKMTDVHGKIKSEFSLKPAAAPAEEVRYGFLPPELNVTFSFWTWVELEYLVKGPMRLVSAQAQSALLGIFELAGNEYYLEGQTGDYAAGEYSGFHMLVQLYTGDDLDMAAEEKGYVYLQVYGTTRLGLFMQSSPVADTITIEIYFLNDRGVTEMLPVRISLADFIPPPPYTIDPGKVDIALVPYDQGSVILRMSGPLKISVAISAHSEVLGDFTLALTPEDDLGSEALGQTPEYANGYRWLFMVRTVGSLDYYEIYYAWQGPQVEQPVPDTITFTIDFVDPFGNHAQVPVTAILAGD